MNAFSQKSLAALETCHPELQRLFNEVIKKRDCTIIEGHRNREAQEAAFAAGKSKLHWPNGNHNKTPSLAVDVLPYPIDWKDTKRIQDFALYVLTTAEKLGIKIRWGGDWNGNHKADESFVDMPHYELKL